MDDFLLVGKTDDLSRLPKKVEANVGAESTSFLCEEVIEAQIARIVLEHDRRPDFVFGVSQGTQNARVLKGFGQLVVTVSGTLDHFTVFRRGVVRDEIEPDATFGPDALDVARLPVLMAGHLLDELFEKIIANPSLARTVGNACLLNGLANDFGEWPIDDLAILLT